MIDDTEAIERILASTVRSCGESVELLSSLGRYLLKDIRAKSPFPGFDQSVMDGYALCSEDLRNDGNPLRIVGLNAAGSEQAGHLNPGEAMRIYTGAPLPLGADAVVMQEEVQVAGEMLVVNGQVSAGDHIRRRGEVVCPGQMIVESGQKITPENIGVIASQGVSSVEVARWPRVSLITTGDELVELGSSTLEFGQVYNSNAVMLQASLRHLGMSDFDVFHVDDQLDSLLEVIRSATEKADVVLIAGGLSVGGRDYVKPCLEECGVDIHFWRVRVKPGKPFLYAGYGAEGQIFGLPGNPVSAMVTFLIFVLPALRLRLGAPIGRLGLSVVKTEALEPIHNRGNRAHYVMGKYESQKGFRALPGQFSQNILGLGQANALARIDQGRLVRRGETIEVSIISGE